MMKYLYLRPEVEIVPDEEDVITASFQDEGTFDEMEGGDL